MDNTTNQTQTTQTGQLVMLVVPSILRGQGDVNAVQNGLTQIGQFRMITGGIYVGSLTGLDQIQTLKRVAQDVFVVPIAAGALHIYRDFLPNQLAGLAEAQRAA